MKKHPSIADIAKRLGMSKASVAAAFSTGKGNTRISEATAARIREAAREMNYRANPSARAISRSRFNTIGFFVAKRKFDDYTVMDVVSQGVTDAAEEAGQTVLLVTVPISPGGTPVVPRLLRENCIDALVVHHAMAVPPAFHEAIAASGVPVVFLNDKRPENAVYIDDVDGGQTATEFLLAQGFRRIVALSPVTRLPHYSAADRIAGYRKAMRRAGLKPVAWTPAALIWFQEIRERLRERPLPEAIFCTDDHFSLLLQRILLEMGLRVPHDISLIGVNDDAVTLHSPVDLTTLRVPFYEMSRAAVGMAVRLVDGKGPLPSMALRSHLIVRKSVRMAR